MGAAAIPVVIVAGPWWAGFETAERVAWRVDELADEMKNLKAEVADTKALANGLAAAAEADRTIGKGQHRG